MSNTTSSAAQARSIKDTRTEQNLVNSYMNESQSYARYMFYAQQAQKENYFPIQKVFEETAANELHHAKVFMKLLEQGQVECTSIVDADKIADTATNLQIAINEERVEGVKAYIEAALIAREEGFPEIADHFEAIAKIEAHHQQRFQTHLDQVKAGTIWKRDHDITWECLVCGYHFVGKEPPKQCPACDHPYQHYMALDIE